MKSNEKWNNKKIIDFTSENAVHEIQSAYAVLSNNCTKRTKCSPKSKDTDEFHPFWNSFKAESSSYAYIKILIKTFQEGSDFPDCNASMWFDVSVARNTVKATCQLNPKISVTLMRN